MKESVRCTAVLLVHLAATASVRGADAEKGVTFTIRDHATFEKPHQFSAGRN